MALTKILKYAVGLFYLIGGPLIHAFLMTYQRDRYPAVDDLAWSGYQVIWTRLVLPNLVPLVVLLVILEMVAGTFMLSKRPRWAALGQLGGMIFNLLLIPFWFGYGMPNLILALVHGWLFRQERRAAGEYTVSKPLPSGQAHAVKV
jgi:hypothetical protein